MTDLKTLTVTLLDGDMCDFLAGFRARETVAMEETGTGTGNMTIQRTGQATRDAYYFVWNTKAKEVVASKSIMALTAHLRNRVMA
jgi:microcompartment protein CcmK/EutM